MGLQDFIRRRSVHRLADELQRQLMDAAPDATMLAAFYREGQRDGKRGRSHEPVRDYVVEAVELAISLIAKKYVDAVEALSREESQLEAAAEGARTQLQVLDTEEDPTAPQHSTEATGLAESLHQWEARRAERAAESKRQQRAQFVRQISESETALRVVRDRRHDLAATYAQLVSSSEEAAQLLWTRYRAGFEAGAIRSKLPQKDSPEPGIRVEAPAVLTRGAAGLADAVKRTE